MAQQLCVLPLRLCAFAGALTLIRARFRGDPAKLAEWDEIVHMCDDLDDDAPTDD